MGSTTLEETEEGHDQVHPVARRSVLSSKCSSGVKFSGFASILARTRMFSLLMLALILTWPSDFGVGAVNFTFNGFKPNDIVLASHSSWILDSDTNCIYFKPPNASGSISVADRFLNQGLVQMADPVSKKVKSFSTTFIYQIWVPSDNNAGMAFIIVPDNSTVRAPGDDYMGLLTATPKNVESDDHTLGVELDTHMNLEFNYSGENHIGINLASTNSTYTCNLASKRKRIYQQVWIDYFEAASRMDISYAYYGQGRPGTPQGIHRGLNLLFHNENMYIGFSSAKGKESDINLLNVCAWSFSNDGLPAPPIVVGRDVFLASPPVPLPSITKTEMATMGALVTLYFVIVISLFYWWMYSRQSLLVFISHTGGQDGSQRNFGSIQCLAGVGKSKKRARRDEKEIGVMTYVRKLLHLLFALSGLLTIIFSVILDNSFNHQPERFVAFAILAPVMIFLGILASGWFPRIPLWLIAYLKRRGFLKHVSACSPWHDNVVTDFCGEICTLESLEQAEGTAFLELHEPVLTFLYGSSISPQEIALAPESLDFQGAASTLEPQGDYHHQASVLQLQNKDSSYKDAHTYGIIKIPPITMVTDQTPLPNFQVVPFPGEDVVASVDCSSKFYVLDEARQPKLTIEGPKINGYSLEVHIFKNTSSRDPTFDLNCTFRNKRTRKLFFTTQKVQNLAQNMYRWVESPYPITTNESSDILHCLAIQDILSEFTKGVHSFKPVRVHHRYLAGFWEVRPWINFSYGALCSFLSLFPLISSEKGYYFLFSLFVIAPYLFISKDTNPLIFYNLREFLCPAFIYIYGFRTLYLSRSWFRWCNEFRKQRVVNPDCFLIDAEYSNNFSDGESCFDVCGFVDIPDPPIIQSSILTCQGRVDPRDPTKRLKQHDYKLDVDFDETKSTPYTNVTLYFYENNDILVRKHYSKVEIRRLYLIQQLFHYYTYSSFGGYVEKICPGVWPETYLAHSPRFVDICHKIISESSIPTFLMAKRVSSSKFIIGVPF